MPLLCEPPNAGMHLIVDCSFCCRTHATAVVQMTHMILRHGGAMPDDRANALYVASAYWSAAVHDFEHGGVNNDFLIKTAHPLAITYNDQSPLENHHLAAATLENLKPQPPVYPGKFCTIALRRCCFKTVSLTLACNYWTVTQAGVRVCQCLACTFQGIGSTCFLAWAACHYFAAT